MDLILDVNTQLYPIRLGEEWREMDFDLQLIFSFLQETNSGWCWQQL